MILLAIGRIHVSAHPFMSVKMPLYLYLISQDENTGYDTYSACVVCAESEHAAARITPIDIFRDGKWSCIFGDMWASCPENVTVKLLGTAAEGLEPGMVLDSFHAG
jgi:hypothetical protein